MDKLTYCFDIDNTICHSPDMGPYDKSTPHTKRIEKVNELYDQGHTIFFMTARGMGRSNNESPLLFEDLTKKQLQEWGVNYHELFMGKPAGDLYIDDKGIKDEDFFDSRN